LPFRSTLSVLTLTLAALIAPYGYAQESVTPTLTVSAQLVVLDVVALDKNGKPAEGLTLKDFQVFEDGKLQQLRSVEPPTAHLLPEETLAAGSSATFDPAEPASFGRSPVNILLFDQSNTHFADTSFGRRSLLEYLKAQPGTLAQPTTLLTVFDGHFKLIQSFTRDRDTLIKALNASPVKYAWNLELNGKTEYGPVERLDQGLRALEQIAQSYSRIPGRKNLIWVGGGYPTVDPNNLPGDEAALVKSTIQHVTGVLLDSHITLYAVDPSSSAAGMDEITDETQANFAGLAADGLSRMGPFDATADFDALGPVTGGRVLRGMNDVSRQIGVSVSLGSSFYTLAYRPSVVTDTAVKFRKITIVCTRPGLTLTTRSGYYTGQSAQQKTEDAAIYDLSTAAESTIPLNGLHIKVEPDLSAGAPPNTYLVHAGVGDLEWKPRADGTSVASVYIMAVSLNAKGKPLGHTVHPMVANARAGAELRDPKQADFVFTAPPSPKTAVVRFVVRDSATGHMGSVDLPVTKH
jgi:VWFA-related protein